MNPSVHNRPFLLPDLTGLGPDPWLLLDAAGGPGHVRGIIAAGATRSLTIDQPSDDAYRQIEAFVGAGTERCFGWLAYDQLRADPLLSLPAQRGVGVPVPVVHWVAAAGALAFEGTGPGADLRWITRPKEGPLAERMERAVRVPRGHGKAGPAHPVPDAQSSLDHPAYLAAFDQVRQHILRGDIYEMNLCRELCGRLPDAFDAERAFGALVQKTAAPYSALIPWGPVRMLSASPECFLERKGNRLTSRPIKGTAPRHEDAAADAAAADRLRLDPKERAENVMITDLVRNDLSRIAQPASVTVEELCGIHSFRNVHQMVSTVACNVREDVRWSDILAATFPMGSMTGAPKLRAMEITAEVEPVQRGLYSGTLGWADPDGRGGVGDFHLNVVIRTVLADLEHRKWSAHVGGAITALAQPEAEWEETRLKARALLEVLEQGSGEHTAPGNVLAEFGGHG